MLLIINVIGLRQPRLIKYTSGCVERIMECVTGLDLKCPPRAMCPEMDLLEGDWTMGKDTTHSSRFIH